MAMGIAEGGLQEITSAFLPMGYFWWLQLQPSFLLPPLATTRVSCKWMELTCDSKGTKELDELSLERRGHVCSSVLSIPPLPPPVFFSSAPCKISSAFLVM